MNLGALMNELALVHKGVLLPAEFMRQHALAIGDPMIIRIQIYGYSVPLTLQIVGNFDISSDNIHDTKEAIHATGQSTVHHL